MYNVLTIGDVHGESWWKEIEDIGQLVKDKHMMPKFDKYVFLGDYTDSFDLSSPVILQNLKEIIQFKKDYPEFVVLLIGNHDVFYMSTNGMMMSGSRPEVLFDFYDLFRKNKKLFQVAYELHVDNKKYLWSHAGVHIGWYKERYSKVVTTENKSLAWNLNNLFERNADCIFDVGYKRGGTLNYGGPLWCDFLTLQRKPIKGYHQIVGHTRRKKIVHVDRGKDTSVTCCDVANSKEYLTLNFKNL